MKKSCNVDKTKTVGSGREVSVKSEHVMNGHVILTSGVD
jgi:hypothetical protein